MSYRIGLGYDVHQLAEGETLWLGGIQIPHDWHGEESPGEVVTMELLRIKRDGFFQNIGQGLNRFSGHLFASIQGEFALLCLGQAGLLGRGARES